MENSNKNASDLTSNGNSTFLTDEGKKIKDVCVEPLNIVNSVSMYSVHSLDDSDFRLMLSNAAKPQYHGRFGNKKKSMIPRMYNTRRLSYNDEEKLSEEADKLLEEFRREAEENQRKVDIESERKHGIVRAFIKEISQEIISNQYGTPLINNNNSNSNNIVINNDESNEKTNKKKRLVDNSVEILIKDELLNGGRDKWRRSNETIKTGNNTNESYEIVSNNNANIAYIDEEECVDGANLSSGASFVINDFNNRMRMPNSDRYNKLYVQGNVVQEMHALNDNNEWNESDKNYWNVNKNPTGYYRNNFSKGNSNYDDNSFKYTSGELHLYGNKHGKYEIIKSPKSFYFNFQSNNNIDNDAGLTSGRSVNHPTEKFLEPYEESKINKEEEIGNSDERKEVEDEIIPTNEISFNKSNIYFTQNYLQPVQNTKLIGTLFLMNEYGKLGSPLKNTDNLTVKAESPSMTQASKVSGQKKREKAKSGKEYKSVYLAESAEGYMGNLSPDEILKCIEGESQARTKTSQRKDKAKDSTTKIASGKKKDKRQNLNGKTSPKEIVNPQLQSSEELSLNMNDAKQVETISEEILTDAKEDKIISEEILPSIKTSGEAINTYEEKSLAKNELYKKSVVEEIEEEYLSADEGIETISEKDTCSLMKSDGKVALTHFKGGILHLTKSDYEKLLEEKHPIEEQLEIEREIRKKVQVEEAEFIEVTRKKKIPSVEKKALSSVQKLRGTSHRISGNIASNRRGSAQLYTESINNKNQRYKHNISSRRQASLGDFIGGNENIQGSGRRKVSHLDAIPILTTPSYSSTSSESKSTSLHEASSATSRQASPDRGVVSSKNISGKDDVPVSSSLNPSSVKPDDIPYIRQDFSVEQSLSEISRIVVAKNIRKTDIRKRLSARKSVFLSTGKLSLTEPQKSWAEIAKSKTHSSILSSENDRSPKFSHGIPSTSNGFKKNGDINGNGDYGNGMVDDDHRPRSVASSSSEEIKLILRRSENSVATQKGESNESKGSRVEGYSFFFDPDVTKQMVESESACFPPSDKAGKATVLSGSNLTLKLQDRTVILPFMIPILPSYGTFSKWQYNLARNIEIMWDAFLHYGSEHYTYDLMLSLFLTYVNFQFSIYQKIPLNGELTSKNA
ncbi:unnamed protein product [Dracunculus medinensis]|uniref:TLDc domain-containing protein n=1 Tax=Dracunculus medinensis TaxID=318479 RepID=A0A158Q4S4_DRAME|nr:unnamed protein product [Dracunculus medinensis]